jgi:outer membrane protein
MGLGSEGICALILAVVLVCSPGRSRASDARHITFREAVEIALEQNNDLRRAANQTLLDQSAVTDARMRFLPDLRLSMSGSKSFEGDLEPADEGLTTGLSSSVTLFDGLANLANLRGAKLEEAAGALDMERTRQTVVFYVISGYLTMIEATEQVTVREENLAAQTDQEERVRMLVDGGERPVSDLYQQQANVASARLSLVEARRTLDLSRVDLVQALELDPTGEYVFEIPPLGETSAGVGTEQDLGSLLARAFERRSDLGAVEVRLEAAGQDERAAEAGRWPSVALSADYGTRYSSGEASAFVDQLDDHRSGSVGISVSLPVFDRQATRQEIGRARINTENTRLALADMRQDVALQVRRAVLDRDAAAERLLAAEAQVQAAGKALEFTQERYSVGTATLYEVTLARADLVAATSAAVSARYNLLWQERLLDYYVGDLDPTGGLMP